MLTKKKNGNIITVGSVINEKIKGVEAINVSTFLLENNLTKKQKRKRGILYERRIKWFFKVCN